MAIETQDVAVITGGASGIGRAAAERFLREGWRVVIAGRRAELGQALAGELGPRALFIQTDVARDGDLRRLVDEALDRFGRIDCFVSNAGAGSATGAIAESSAEALDRDLALYVRAPFLAMKFAAPSMAARGKGSFVNVSSISGRAAGFNAFGYEVGKAALNHLTRCAALEFGEQGIRVNSVSPGPTLTGIFAKHVGGDVAGAEGTTERLEAAFAARLPEIQPLAGMAQPQDIAAAVWFLASDAARFVNGHDLVVDGGITAGRPARVMRRDWRALAVALSPAEVAT